MYSYTFACDSGEQIYRLCTYNLYHHIFICVVVVEKSSCHCHTTLKVYCLQLLNYTSPVCYYQKVEIQYVVFWVLTDIDIGKMKGTLVLYILQ